MDLILLAVLAAMILLLVNQNRKRKRDAANLVQTLQVGSNVILHAGIKGTVIAIGEDDLAIETTPCTKPKVLKQALRAIQSPEAN